MFLCVSNDYNCYRGSFQLRVRVTVQRRASEAERSDAKRSEECTRKMHRETDVRRQCWGIPNNTCFAFIRLIRSTSIVAEATGGTPRRKEFRGVRRTKSKAPGESLGNPNESEELPKKTKKETPGESLGNPNATATAGEDKKSLTKTTACEKKPDNTERPTNAQDRAGGPVQRRPEITDGVRLTG